MAYFAEIENGKVVRVISINNSVINEPNITFPETEVLGQTFIAETLRLGGLWKQTSFNSNFRKNYAGTGYTYDEERDAFIAPKPEEGNWVLNEETCLWEEIVEEVTE